MVERKASVKQPGQATEVHLDDAVPEASEGKQTFITDFFHPRPTTSSADIPRSFDTIRAFIRARSETTHGQKKTEKEAIIIVFEASGSFHLSLRDEEDEEEEGEEGVTRKEIWRLNLIHLRRTVLLMTSPRFLDACVTALLFIFTIFMVLYGLFHLAF